MPLIDIKSWAPWQIALGGFVSIYLGILLVIMIPGIVFPIMGHFMPSFDWGQVAYTKTLDTVIPWLTWPLVGASTMVDVAMNVCMIPLNVLGRLVFGQPTYTGTGFYRVQTGGWVDFTFNLTAVTNNLIEFYKYVATGGG